MSHEVPYGDPAVGRPCCAVIARMAGQHHVHQLGVPMDGRVVQDGLRDGREPLDGHRRSRRQIVAHVAAR
jgi:hypothetical protein